MDPVTAAATTIISAPYFLKILEMVLNLGPIGLVLVVWYFDKQKTDDVLRIYSANMQTMFDKYTQDMHEMRQMYLTNASLVKRYADMAGDLKEIITLSTQTMTRLVDRIDREVCK